MITLLVDVLKILCPSQKIRLYVQDEKKKLYGCCKYYGSKQFMFSEYHDYIVCTIEAARDDDGMLLDIIRMIISKD